MEGDGDGRCGDLLRLVGFIFLHLANYTTNLATMCIVYMRGHWKYLALLLPVHAVIGGFCAYTAVASNTRRRWNPCTYFFAVVFMGAMQGVQVKLACEDYAQQRLRRRNGGRGDAEGIPASMPARFHCKAVDGILEGQVFAWVAMYAILKRDWQDFDPVQLTPGECAVLYACAVCSFLTTGLALMEVDHRTSTAVQRLLERSALAQARHLLFRSCELACRLLTVIVFCACMRPGRQWWLALVTVAADYILGVVLLVVLGGREPMQPASLLLGVPLLMVNIMQFVDAPGLSLQARRISSVIVPLRTLEMLAVAAFAIGTANSVPVMRPPSESVVTMRMRDFLLQVHPRWVMAWALSAAGYCLLLLSYACRVRPGVDLHSAVAFGDVGALRELLQGSELVLDLNRYGPDGRAPLHLAALRGQVDCIRLLVQERANLHLRTNNRQRNTALHLAAMGPSPAAVHCLRQLSRGDRDFLDAANADGDTALHVAARKHNLDAIQELLKEPSADFRLKNNQGETPADFAANPRNFFFDRNSPEFAIQELLRRAESGAHRTHSSSHRGSSLVVELSDLSAPSSLTREGARSSSRGSGPAGAGASADVEVGGAEGAGGEAMGAEASEAPEAEDAQQHRVPLLAVGAASEQEILRRQQRTDQAAPQHLAVTNCGISSFMLSAGLGALSQMVLSSIQDGAEDTCSGLPATQVSFDDFADVRKLGEGAFGKVNLVQHKSTGELFAMKLMDKAKFRAQKITSKARSEQYILKTTRHPFIVSLHYAFQGSIFWVLVMEYCPHGDLQGLLCEYGTPGLPPPDCARLMGEVLLAVEHLHSIQVIFRDLKPENVVLDSGYRAKVTDFGLAKKLGGAADASTMCGSWGYVAPEIMTSKGGYTYAVDLYSYGVMLYLMLSGGEASPKKQQRLPPMRHAELRRKLRAADRDAAADWARPQLGALALLSALTNETPRTRTTATEIKGNAFFTNALGRPVDSLLAERGPFGPPRGGGGSEGEPASAGAQRASGARASTTLEMP